MSPVRQFLLAIECFVLLALFQGLEGALLRGKQQFRQAIIPQRGVHKKDNECGQDRNPNIGEPSQPLPASALRIVKDRFGHGKLSDHRMLHAADGQFSK